MKISHNIGLEFKEISSHFRPFAFSWVLCEIKNDKKFQVNCKSSCVAVNINFQYLFFLFFVKSLRKIYICFVLVFSKITSLTAYSFFFFFRGLRKSLKRPNTKANCIEKKRKKNLLFLVLKFLFTKK